jgi:hypothetical protein
MRKYPQPPTLSEETKNFDQQMAQVYSQERFESLYIPLLLKRITAVSGSIFENDGAIQSEFTSYDSDQCNVRLRTSIDKPSGKQQKFLRIDIANEVSFDYYPPRVKSVRDEPEVNFLSKFRSAINNEVTPVTYSDVQTPATLANFNYFERFDEGIGLLAAYGNYDPLIRAFDKIK